MQARPDFSKLYSAYKYARTFLVRGRCSCVYASLFSSAHITVDLSV